MSADTLSTSELNEITSALTEAENESMATVPESIFKEVYLPVFSGEVVNNRVVHVWLHMVGGPMRRARVVEDATGRVLFEVPSWYTTKHMKIDAPKDTSEPSFAETVAQALMCISHSPMKATAAFEDLTRRHLRASIVKGDAAQHNSEWIAIFARYGVTFETILANLKKHLPAEEQAQEAATPSTQEDATGSMDDGYIVEE